MPRVATLLSSFNAGEWSPLLHGRSDLAEYRNACRSLVNMIGLPQGAATRRPGTRFVAETKRSLEVGDREVRLVPFQYSIEQAYILEFGHEYIRVYTNEGRVESPPGTPVEVTPIGSLMVADLYKSADLDQVKWAQSANALFLVHPNYPPRQVIRQSHTAWTIDSFAIEDGPYLDMNTTEVTITPSGKTAGASITLTASTGLFQPGHVGSVWRIEERAGHLNYDNWEEARSYSLGALVKNADRVYEAKTAAASGTRPPLHSRGTESDGAINWEYRHSGHGWVKITAVPGANSTTATASVMTELPIVSPTATIRWREGAWSALRGYPSSVAFYEERLWFGGSRYQPQTFWASTSNVYTRFAPTENGSTVIDDSAMTFTISDNQVNAIHWLSPGRVMTIGTSGGEFTVQGATLSEPLTPNKVSVRGQSTVGASDQLPVKVDNTILFVQRAGRQIFEIAYRFDSDSFAAPEMSLLARHLTQSGIRAIVWQSKPWSVLWCAMMDGGLTAMTYLRDQDVVGWHRHLLGGRDPQILSMAVVPALRQDQLWLTVERDVGGQRRRYIEYLEDEFWPEPESAKDQSYFVDCGLSYDGWNKDPVKTFKIAGGAPWGRGQIKTLVATGHMPFTPLSIGKQFRFRKSGTLWPAISVKVTGFIDSMSAQVELLDDLPGSLQNLAVDWWGAAIDSVYGLDHLVGETLQVLTDGAAHPDRLVVETLPGAGFDLQQPAVVVHAGLGYESRLETLNLEAGAADGSAVSKPQRIHRAVVRLFGSLGCKVGYDEEHLDRIQFRVNATPMDSSPSLFTGDKLVEFPKGWDRQARILIVQDQPLPLIVTAISPRLTTNDG